MRNETISVILYLIFYAFERGRKIHMCSLPGRIEALRGAEEMRRAEALLFLRDKPGGGRMDGQARMRRRAAKGIFDNFFCLVFWRMTD